MKKLFGMLVLLFALYFLYQVTFVYFQGGHNIDYEISDGNNLVKINEILRSGNKSDADNYSISLVINDTNFNVQTFYNFNRSSKIISTVRYYEDNEHKCVFIRYRNNKVLNDILCNDDNIIIPLHNLDIISDGLKEFAKEMVNYGYDENNWKDNTSGSIEKENATLYPKNLVNNHYLGVSSPSGLYRINKIDQIKYVKVYTTNLNNNQPILKGFVNDKYIVANYDDEQIYRFFVSNLTNNGSNMFATKVISNSTFVLGSFGTSLYIYDPDAKKEYELDYDSQSLLEVGNEETDIVFYSEGKWQRTPITSNLNTLNFGNNYSNDYVNNEYEKIIKVGNKYGYYYLFKKVNDRYIAYRSDVTNSEVLTYLFTTTNINNLVFTDDYIYYISDGSLKYYSDATGNRTVITNSNILNPSNVSIGVYVERKKELF